MDYRLPKVNVKQLPISIRKNIDSIDANKAIKSSNSTFKFRLEPCIGRPLTKDDFLGPLIEKLQVLNRIRQKEDFEKHLDIQKNTSIALRENSHKKCEVNNEINCSNDSGQDSYESDDSHMSTSATDSYHDEISLSDLDNNESNNASLDSSECIFPPFIESLFDIDSKFIRFVHLNQKIQGICDIEISAKLRWRLSSITPEVVKDVVKRSHFKLFNKTHNWIGYFGKQIKNPRIYRCMGTFQKINHFPGSYDICRKDKLWINLSHMRARFGSNVYDYYPQTFCLKRDFSRFKAAWKEEADPKSPQKSKPAAARGIGIKVVNQWSDITKNSAAIVQRYIHKPFLVNENKFDLRIYVYVTSYNPLRIYLHKKGLVRFATSKYTNSNNSIKNRCVHLTNFSVNKRKGKYFEGSDAYEIADDRYHKWTLDSLWNTMEERGIKSKKIWREIKSLVVKTICSAALKIGSLVNCYCSSPQQVHELYGLDILIDSNLKPWLLEVNMSPSMNSKSPLDRNIKSEIITDMFNIAGYRLPLTDEQKSLRVESSDGTRNVSRNGAKNIRSSLQNNQKLFEYFLNLVEKQKHREFTMKYRDFTQINSFTKSTLSNKTQDDLRVLRYCVDEFNRANMGNFDRIFPLSTQEDYEDQFRFVRNDFKGRKASNNNEDDKKRHCYRYYDQLLRDFLTHFYCEMTDQNRSIVPNIKESGIEYLKN